MSCGGAEHAEKFETENYTTKHCAPVLDEPGLVSFVIHLDC